VPWVVNEAVRRSGTKGFPKNPCKEFNIYITAQTDDDFPYVLKYAGEDNIVIGTDYGHTDASSEVDAIEVFRKNDTIGEEVKKKILDDNPRTLYGV
jgi:predicted TIM-barrel fold metal-dependent hydrolase